MLDHSVVTTYKLGKLKPRLEMKGIKEIRCIAWIVPLFGLIPDGTMKLIEVKMTQTSDIVAACYRTVEPQNLYYAEEKPWGGRGVFFIIHANSV